jgi:GTPase SAR1 family protein
MILNQKAKQIRVQVEDSVKDLHQLVDKIGHKELSATLSDLRNRMTEPFMFVIVGEVKAGKSSFINALLNADGREICKVAPQPMTDTIQQIFYGEQEETIVVNPFLKKVFVPVDILREIAIVDTPGTNSIEEKHQEVTEKFIPASDLVIFVFESKNPYRQSAWNFFDFIHKDWHKKIIFVLQQKDLMSPEDLAVNNKGLYEFAEKKGLVDAQIFEVSAKNELDGKYDESGFSRMRDYIRTHVTGGRGMALKLKNNLDTAFNIMARIRTDLDARNKQYHADVAFRKDINETLTAQEAKSKHHVNQLIENLLSGYDRITVNTAAELESNLSFFSLAKRSFMGIFSKQASIQDSLEDLSKKMELNLNAELKTKLNDGVVDLADSIQQMAKMIDLKIQNSSTVMHSDRYIFEDIAEKRSSTLHDLQEAFARFMARSESFRDDRLFPSDTAVSSNIATGSGVAIIGMVILAVTNITVIDITGGILTSIGMIFAGVTASMQRKKITNGFYEEVKKGRANMESALRDKLSLYVSTIRNRISENFSELDAMLANESKDLEQIDQQFDQIDARLKGLNAELIVND